MNKEQEALNYIRNHPAWEFASMHGMSAVDEKLVESFNILESSFKETKTLKAKEVMEILGITRVTLCHYVKSGKLKVTQAFDGAKYNYDYDSVMRLKEGK